MNLDVGIKDPYKLLTYAILTKVSDVLYWFSIGVEISKVRFEVSRETKNGKHWLNTTLYFQRVGGKEDLEAKVAIVSDDDDVLNYHQILHENDFGISFVVCRVPRVEDRDNTVFAYWK